MNDNNCFSLADAYAILGIEPDADERTIKLAYRRLAKKHHPDVNPHDAAAEKRFRDIQCAYDLLKEGRSTNTYERGAFGVHRGFFVDGDVHPFFGFYEALKHSGLLKKKS